MKGAGLKMGAVFCLWIVPYSIPAQQLAWKEQHPAWNLNLCADSGQSPVRLRLSHRLEYSLTFSGVFFINWDHDPNKNQVMLIQDMTYECRGETDRRFRFSQKIVHHLGIQFFFDSISRIHVDDNQLDTRLEWRIRKNHGCFFSALLSTRLFNGYTLTINANGNQDRILNSSFLTPLTVLFSGGIQFKWPFFGSFNLGITSAKLTWLRDKSIYEEQHTIIYYGVPEDKGYLFEYGISLHLLIDHNIAKWLRWNCDLLVFKNMNLPPDISIRNNLAFRLAKHLRAAFQTRLFYEERISRKVQLENIVSVGIVVSI